MIYPRLLLLSFCCAMVISIAAQQRPDLNFPVSIDQARFKADAGPVIGIDAGHNNLHQLEGGFAPFARLARADGYRTKSMTEFSTSELDQIDILVIANALHTSNVGNWQNPVPSAFTGAEIDLLQAWVERGGRLWVIADHMPYGGAAQELGKRFGFLYENGFIIRKEGREWPPELYTKADGTLYDNELTQNIDTLASFTGSALQAPEGAMVIGHFPETHHLLLPEIAWQFEERTEIRPVEGYVLGAVQAYGKGKVAFFTEAAMLTAQLVQENFKVGFNSPAAPQNQQFVLNVLHWLDESATGKSLPEKGRQ